MYTVEYYSSIVRYFGRWLGVVIMIVNFDINKFCDFWTLEMLLKLNLNLKNYCHHYIYNPKKYGQFYCERKLCRPIYVRDFEP